MVADPTSQWGKLIREARQAKGLGQVQLAELVETDQGTVSKWELGLRVPSDAMKVRVAAALDKQPGELFPWDAIEVA